MKKIINLTAILSLLIVFLPGCQAIGDIFKAGVWTGIIVIVAIVGLIIFLVTRSRK